MPFWKSSDDQYFTPDPESSPSIYYLIWVVADNIGGFDAGITNNAYVNGFNCPYEIPDQWEYETGGEWFVDPHSGLLVLKLNKQKLF